MHHEKAVIQRKIARSMHGCHYWNVVLARPVSAGLQKYCSNADGMLLATAEQHERKQACLGEKRKGRDAVDDTKDHGVHAGKRTDLEVEQAKERRGRVRQRSSVRDAQA